MAKSILMSKTFWVNAIVALLLGLAGIQIGDAKTELAVVAVINIVLRIATNEPVKLK